MERALLLMVPLWPAIGAVVLTAAGLLGGRSRGRFVAVMSVALSLGCLGAGAVLLGGWPGPQRIPLVDGTWLSSQLAGDLFRFDLAIDGASAAWVWTAAVAVLTLLLADMRADAPDESLAGPAVGVEARCRAAQLGCLAAIQTAALAQDLGLLLAAIVVGVGLSSLLVSEASAAAVRRMRWAAGLAVGLMLLATGWTWHFYDTLDLPVVTELARETIDDEAGLSRLRMVSLLFATAALVLAGTFPFFVWVRDVSASRQAGFALAVGPLSLGLLLLLRMRPLHELATADGGGGGPIGMAAITALLAGFLSLTSSRLREAAGCAAVVWTATAAVGLCSNAASTLVGGVVLALVLPLVVGLWLTLDRGATHRTFAGWLALLVMASGCAGLWAIVEPGLQGLWTDGSALTGALHAALLLGHAAVCFALAKGLCLASAHGRVTTNDQKGNGLASSVEVPHPHPLSQGERGNRRRDLPSDIGQGLALGLVVGLSIVPFTAYGPLLLAANVGRPTQTAFPIGPVPIVGGMAVLGAWLLYRRSSPWPRLLAERCDSIDRLSRRWLYLDEIAAAGEESLATAAGLWRAADMPMLRSRSSGSIAAAPNASSLDSSEAGTGAAWTVAGVVLTAAVVWGMLIWLETLP